MAEVLNIKIATESDIDKLIPALKELRPHRSEDDIRAMLPMLMKEGYRVAFVGNDQLAYSVLGFRILTFFYSGKTLYIDDLSTLSGYRKSGYARMLFDYTKQYAKSEGCDHFSLDSGFQRKDAHRFYLNQGLLIESMHFGRSMNELLA